MGKTTWKQIKPFIRETIETGTFENKGPGYIVKTKDFQGGTVEVRCGLDEKNHYSISTAFVQNRAERKESGLDCCSRHLLSKFKNWALSFLKES